jgi:hypothetical protein
MDTLPAGRREAGLVRRLDTDARKGLSRHATGFDDTRDDLSDDIPMSGPAYRATTVERRHILRDNALPLPHVPFRVSRRTFIMVRLFQFFPLT